MKGSRPGATLNILPLNGFRLLRACAYANTATALVAGFNELPVQVPAQSSAVADLMIFATLPLAPATPLTTVASSAPPNPVSL